MIDTATIERYMRDANPIPHIDDIDPDEFARFVAAATTRRAAINTATTMAAMGLSCAIQATMIAV